MNISSTETTSVTAPNNHTTKINVNVVDRKQKIDEIVKKHLQRLKDLNNKK